MEIKYLGHKEIDYRKWESCVSNSLNVTLYAHSWFLDQVSLSWNALVMDDYDAVMPVFQREGKVYLPDVITWTGIYSRIGLSAELCQAFVHELDRRFQNIDLVFDKFFVMPESKCRGVFSQYPVYQLETINAKLPIPVAVPMWDCMSVPDQTKNIKCATFMGLDKKLNIRQAQKLMALAKISVGSKYGYYIELSKNHVDTQGVVFVNFCDGYIFLSFMRCSKDLQVVDGQYTLIAEMVMRHFAGRPGILVIDPQKSGVNIITLTKLGADKYSAVRYKCSIWTKIAGIFKL